MRNVWTIARREYSRFFTSPVAYVIAFVIMLTLGIMFSVMILAYMNAAISGSLGPGQAPDISGITGTFVFLFVLTIPALTMRLVSDENRMGTMELLLTAPVRDWELIVGKWLGGFLFILTVILISLIYPLVLNSIVSPGIDQMQMVIAYAGVILVAASFLAIGVGVSAMFTNQIAAFFATLAVLIVLYWMMNFAAQYVTAGADFFGYLNLQHHFYDSMNTGVVNLSDLAYFLSLIALGLFTGTTAVEMRRWS